MTSSASSSSSSSSGILSTPSQDTSHHSLTPIQHLITIKLNRDNYLLWKAQIVPYLKGQHLFGFIDGSQNRPFLLSSSYLHKNLRTHSQSCVPRLAISRSDDSLCTHLIYIRKNSHLRGQVHHIS